MKSPLGKQIETITNSEQKVHQKWVQELIFMKGMKGMQLKETLTLNIIYQRYFFSMNGRWRDNDQNISQNILDGRLQVSSSSLGTANGLRLTWIFKLK